MDLDFQQRTIEAKINISHSLQLHHVTVAVDILHPKRGYMKISLKSPPQTVSVLFDEHGDTDPNITPNWTFSSLRYWGELSGGEWTLVIEDRLQSVVYASSQRKLVSWKLNLYGIPS